MIALFNNKFISPSQAKISMLSDTFMYGFGVFETLQIKGNKPLQANEHIKRLFNSAKQIDLKIKYSAPQISTMLKKVCTKSKDKEQRVKIIAVTEGVLITSTKLITRDLKDGVKCMSIQVERPMPKTKTISYLETFISHNKAQKKGFFEAILVDKEGYVTEGSRSNLFWFEGNTLCTRKDHVLGGIIRDEVIKKSQFKIKFKKIKLTELLRKKEIFITSSIIKIAPVTQINKSKIGNGKPGDKTKKLFSVL